MINDIEKTSFDLKCLLVRLAYCLVPWNIYGMLHWLSGQCVECILVWCTVPVMSVSPVLYSLSCFNKCKCVCAFIIFHYIYFG